MYNMNVLLKSRYPTQCSERCSSNIHNFSGMAANFRTLLPSCNIHSPRLTILQLGGTEKIQATLHFISQYLPRCTTGTIYLYAASDVSLDAEFACVHKLLGESVNNIGPFN